MKTPVQQHGFTIIELMISLSLLAIIMSLAAPMVREYSAAQRIRSAGFDLHSDLLMARSEALKRNRNVRIAAFGAGWTTGWTVRIVDTGQLLRFRPALAKGIAVESGSVSTLVFTGDGRVQGALGPTAIGLGIEVGDETLSRCLRIDPSGRPRVVREACS